jgi:hypothetical protein
MSEIKPLPRRALESIPPELLGAVRQRLGVGALDTSRDAEILTKPDYWLLEQYSAWYLGDGSWGRAMYEFVLRLEGRQWRST